MTESGAEATSSATARTRPRAARQQAHRSKLVAQLEAEIATMKTDSDRGHSKRMCALLTSSRYGRYLRETPGGKLRIDRGAVTDAKRYDGKWVIISNSDTLSVEDLALGYSVLPAQVREEAIRA